jgi:uncharacterized protein YcfL
MRAKVALALATVMLVGCAAMAQIAIGAAGTVVGNLASDAIEGKIEKK